MVNLDNRFVNVVILTASALILVLEISIFVSVLPSKVYSLQEYKKQVNSTLSDKDFLNELISQNLAQESQISELEAELADKDIILSYLSSRLNTSLNITVNPFNRIRQEDVQVFNDRIIIHVNKAFPARFTESKSMYPFINQGSYALEVKPGKSSELNIGDVIGFASQAFNTTIIHRIISIGEDEQGWYAITKGDNNPAPDPGKVRFNDIQGVLVGLIY